MTTASIPEHRQGSAVELLGESPAVRRAREAIGRAVVCEDPVLIVGEHGIEPEPVAREIHTRQDGSSPLVVFDCAGGSAGAVARTLFGSGAPPVDGLEEFEPGSLLGAARGGTLFLREVGELPAACQARLARLLRDSEARFGGQTVPLGVRIIASAPPTLTRDAEEGRFRMDLHHRFRRLRIDVPPLRERADDMPAIVRAVLASICAGAGRHAPEVTPAAITALSSLSWTGNFEELRGMLTRILARLGPDAMIRQEEVVVDLQQTREPLRRPLASRSLREARAEFEREYVTGVLEAHGWSMSDAARALGIQRANLYRKARQLGIGRTRQAES